jgi:hypothetical protein
MNIDMENLKIWTAKLAERSARLVRLLELNAPVTILGHEKRLIHEALEEVDKLTAEIPIQKVTEQGAANVVMRLIEEELIDLDDEGEDQ